MCAYMTGQVGECSVGSEWFQAIFMEKKTLLLQGFVLLSVFKKRY